MLAPILSNIIVGLLIVALVGFAIRTLLKKDKSEGCPSCGKPKKNPCANCPWAGNCNHHIH